MEKHLEVLWWNGERVGHIIHRGPIYFVYDQDWIKSGHNLSPLSLPFSDIAFNGHKGIDGLPGLIADCLPDSWGLKLARKEFSKHKWGEPSTLGLLAWRGSRGLGPLRFIPPLNPSLKTPTIDTISAEALARGAAEIQRNEPSKVLPQLVKGGTAGGAFPKALVLSYPDGTLKVGAPDNLGLPCILKFDLSESGQNARCEHAYTLMAIDAGINTVRTSLLDEQKGSHRTHLLVERFDIPNHRDSTRRIHFHSLSGLLHHTPQGLDYRDLLRTTIKLHCDPSEIREVIRRMIFNVLASNHDDHGKNHAFIYDENTRMWTLSPAYDLTPSQVVLERGMTINEEVFPTYSTMESLAMEAGVKKVEFKQIFDTVDGAASRWSKHSRTSAVPSAFASEIKSRLREIRKKVLR